MSVYLGGTEDSLQMLEPGELPHQVAAVAPPESPTNM